MWNISHVCLSVEITRIKDISDNPSIPPAIHQCSLGTLYKPITVVGPRDIGCLLSTHIWGGWWSFLNHQGQSQSLLASGMVSTVPWLTYGFCSLLGPRYVNRILTQSFSVLWHCLSSSWHGFYLKLFIVYLFIVCRLPLPHGSALPVFFTEYCLNADWWRFVQWTNELVLEGTLLRRADLEQG